MLSPCEQSVFQLIAVQFIAGRVFGVSIENRPGRSIFQLIVAQFIPRKTVANYKLVLATSHHFAFQRLFETIHSNQIQLRMQDNDKDRKKGEGRGTQEEKRTRTHETKMGTKMGTATTTTTMITHHPPTHHQTCNLVRCSEVKLFCFLILPEIDPVWD